MKVAALGVTGGTGKHLLELCTGRGHEVVALARRPEAVELKHERLRVEPADVRRPETMVEAFRGADAVISVLGVSGLLAARKGTDVYSVGTRSILEAMTEAGASRLLVVSSGGVEPQPNDNWIYTNVLKRFFLEPIYRDMRTMEAAIGASSTEYTIVRASFLVGDKHKEDYRVRADTPFPDDKSLSRWSLAHFLIEETERAEHPRRVVYLSN